MIPFGRSVALKICPRFERIGRVQNSSPISPSRNALVTKVLNDIYPNFGKIGFFDLKTGLFGQRRRFRASIDRLAHIKVAKSNTPAWIAASRGVLQGAVVVAIIGPAFKLKEVSPRSFGLNVAI